MKTKKDDIKKSGMTALILLALAAFMWFLPWNYAIGEGPLPKWKTSILLFLLLSSWGILAISVLAALSYIGYMVYIAVMRDDKWYVKNNEITKIKEIDGLNQVRYATDLQLFNIACENFPEETPEQVAFKNLCQLFYNEANRFFGTKTRDIIQVMKIHLDTIKSSLPNESEGEILSEIKPMVKRAETLIEQAEELIH